MDDEQHEQIMFRLRELEKLILQQDSRAIRMMDRIANIEHAVNTINEYVNLAIVVGVLYCIAQVIGIQNAQLLLILAVAAFLIFLPCRWLWRKLRRSDKQQIHG